MRLGRHTYYKSKQNIYRGVTLVELLVTLSIMAILSAIAIPSFSSMVQDFAISGQVNSMNADVRYARSEAMKRGINVVLCPSADPLATTPTCSGTSWRTGWIIFVDSNNNAASDAGELLLRRQESLSDKSGGITATQNSTNLGNISMNRDGRVPATVATATVVVTFLSTGTGSNQQSKFLCVSTNGRPKAVKLANLC